MKALVFFLLLLGTSLNGQNLYFPPAGNNWESLSPDSMGWCNDRVNNLYDYLDQSKTKAFLVLVNGRLVLEKYFGTFTKDSFYVWNSAGKTLTGVAVGIAEQKGLLSVNDSSSQYLGSGWTSLSAQQEGKITVLNQLTMTSGLGHTGDHYCTDPACLIYVAAPDTRWSYHNGPYTLLDQVIESASGQTLNAFVQAEIRSKIGMDGFYYKIGYNNINFSTARSMARFGLFMLAQGAWNQNQILNQAYFNSMINSSQSMNPSYGRLTWLNGKSSWMVPSPDVQISLPGKALPSAPDDLFAAIGKNGQIINVVPSQNLVLVRMGSEDGGSLVPNEFNDSIWQYMNLLPCTSHVGEPALNKLLVYPHPVYDRLFIDGLDDQEGGSVRIFNSLGQLIFTCPLQVEIDVKDLPSGFYQLEIGEGNALRRQTLIKI